MLLLRLMVNPTAGAGPFSVTVPTALEPPATVEGLTDSPVNATGTMVNWVDIETEEKVAVILAMICLPTGPVVIVNVTLLAPAGTMTLAGTFATPVLLTTSTLTPPVGASPLSVTVPVDCDPPPTTEGFTVIVRSAGGLMVSVPLTCEPVIFATTVATSVLLTGDVEQEKLPELIPADIVTEVGPPHAASFEVRVTLTPPEGAGDPSETVPVEAEPPFTAAGLNTRDLSFAGSTVMVADFELLPSAALMTPEVVVLTGDVLTAKVAELAPLGTVTVGETVAAEDDQVRYTTTPPAPAFADRVTFPTEFVPPGTVLGERLKPVRVVAKAALVATITRITTVILTNNLITEAVNGCAIVYSTSVPFGASQAGGSYCINSTAWNSESQTGLLSFQSFQPLNTTASSSTGYSKPIV